MKKNIYLTCGLLFIILFIIFTISLKFVDVKPIGPNYSFVGYSSINKTFHSFTNTNMVIYHITDYGGIPPIIMGMLFGILGLIQLIKRRSILKVDRELLILGLFYVVIFLIYLSFELYVINRRPILINGYLEASYPSSTTFLSITFMLSAIPIFDKFIKNKKLLFIIKIVLIVYMLFLVIGRLFSGVHWLTDIMGSILISTGLLFIYNYLLLMLKKVENN